MSHGTEQNLDDFIKSLREATERETENIGVHTKVAKEEFTTEDLQNRLKSLYQSSDAMTLEEQEENAYALDESFLQEAVNGDTDKQEESREEAFAEAEGENSVENAEEFLSTVKTKEKIVSAFVEEKKSLESFGEQSVLSSEDDLPPWEEDPILQEAPLISLKELNEPSLNDSRFENPSDIREEVLADDEEAEEAVALVEEPITIEEEDLPVEGLVGEITDEDLIGEDFSMEDLLAEKALDEDLPEDFSAFELDLPKDERDALRAETWSNHEEKLPIESEAEAITPNIEMDIDREEPQELMSNTAFASDVDSSATEEEFDLATVDLMLQLGCEDELEQSFGENKVRTILSTQYEDDIPLDMRNYIRDGEEEHEAEIDAERVERIQEGYRSRRMRMVLRLIGASVLTVALMFFELLPFLKVEYNGILDYNEYPKAYLLFGLQLFIFVLACSWKELWVSAKKTFFLRPDRYSSVILASLAILLYDIVLLCSSLVEMPAVFHFAGACILLVSQIAEYMMLLREIKIFSVFFSEGRKYTLASISGEHSLAAQMSLNDGTDLHICAARNFKIPRGYFRSVADRDEHKLYYSSFVAVVLAVILCVLGIVLKADAVVAFRIAIIALLAMLPVPAVFQFVYPLFVAATRLRKRDCAVTGKGSISKYADTHVLLLRDLHLFTKCRAKNAGIVFYREDQTSSTIAALHALYSAIGGPMEGVFEELAPQLRAENIRIHRIARNGIEALVDDRHVLLAGELDFMKRYGLTFPQGSTSIDQSVTLYVSLDHEATAKISVRYAVQPTFEMLVDRMAREGIRCVIETYDPLINSAMVARLRGRSGASVSVLHKNASDFNRRDQRHQPINEITGVVAGASRLKLVESVIWCCRLRKIDRWSQVTTVLFSSVAMFLAVLFTALLAVDRNGIWLDWLNQLTLLFYELLAVLSGVLITKLIIPRKKYFMTESYLREREQEVLKRQTQKETKKKRKKNESEYQ